MALKNNTWKVNQWYGQAVAGNISYLAPDDPNKLFVWGGNDYGQLGLNDTAQYSSPTQVPGEWDKIWRHSSATSYMTMAAKTAGSLWVWGNNTIGQLGQNDTVRRSSPVQIPGTTWSKVCTASQWSMAIKTDGTMWAWGDGEYGELGQNQSNSGGFDGTSSPVQIPSKAGTTWTYVSAGENGANAINSAGEWYSWGRYYYGAPFNATGNDNRSSPTQIPGTDWAFVDYSSSCGAAIKTNGTLWTWGANNNGALGINEQGDFPGMATSRSSPTQVPGTTWSKCYCDSDAMYGFKTDGSLWVWGANASGQLGLNQGNVKYSSPVQLPGTWSNSYMDFSVANSPLAIKSDGSLWSWGKNQAGVNGQNDETQRSSPTQIGSATHWDVCAVSGGPSPHASALTT
ncbi:MAG: hypothetical protein VYE26_01165 [Pseudomonadota bacterium]|nr:hypothetical protein [Pseudomonadota bacterium]